MYFLLFYFQFSNGKLGKYWFHPYNFTCTAHAFSMRKPNKSYHTIGLILIFMQWCNVHFYISDIYEYITCLAGDYCHHWLLSHWYSPFLFHRSIWWRNIELEILAEASLASRRPKTKRTWKIEIRSGKWQPSHRGGIRNWNGSRKITEKS